MSINANTHWECETGGSDINGGGFNPATAGVGVADLAVTGSSGQSATPTVSSATYTFVAGDVNAWLFIKSGGTFIPGWYQITAVAGGVATLRATIGQAVLLLSGRANGLSTVQGCSTAGTGTTGVFCIDYSQQNAATYAVADAVTNGTTTITSATAGFTKAMIGTLLYIQGGTGGIVAGWFEIITCTAGNTITVDRATLPTLTAGITATLNVGGAFKSMGQAGAVKIASNKVFGSGGYTLGGTTANVALGPVSDTTGGTSGTNISRWEGYGTYRGDKAAKYTITTAAAQNGFTLVASSGTAVEIDSLAVNNAGNGTTVVGFDLSGSRSFMYRCKATACTGIGISLSSGEGMAWFCETTTCTSASGAFNASGGGGFYFCEAYANTTHGFNAAGNNVEHIRCTSAANSGTADGFTSSSRSAVWFGCIAYNNGRHGFNLAGTGSQTCIDCLSEGNVAAGAYGFTSTAGVTQGALLIRCGGYNNSNAPSNATNVNTTNIPTPLVSFVHGSASFFTTPGSYDFSLNTAAGGGAAARAAGLPTMPHSTQTGFPDIGAVQHQDGAAVVGYRLVLQH